VRAVGGEDDCVGAEAGEVVFEGAFGPVKVVGVAFFFEDGGTVFDDDAEFLDAAVGEEDFGLDATGGGLGAAGGDFADTGEGVFVWYKFNRSFENSTESRDSECSRESVFFICTKKIVALLFLGCGYHVGANGEESALGGDGFKGDDGVSAYSVVKGLEGFTEDDFLALVAGDGEVGREEVVDVLRHGSVLEEIVLDGAAHVQRISADSQSDSGASVGMVGVAFHVRIHDFIRNLIGIPVRDGRKLGKVSQDSLKKILGILAVPVKVVNQQFLKERVKVNGSIVFIEFKQLSIV